MKSCKSLKMGHVGSKTRSLGQILEKSCVGHTFSLIKSWMSMKMGHVGLKTRSLVHILEKPCAHSRGQIFCQILVKPGQNVCLDEISDKFKNGSCSVKNLVTRSNLRITYACN